MRNCETMLTEVAELIAKADREGIDHRFLLFKDDKFLLVPTEALGQGGYIITVLSRAKFEKGMTARDWTCLKIKIANVMEQIKCRKNHPEH